MVDLIQPVLMRSCHLYGVWGTSLGDALIQYAFDFLMDKDRSILGPALGGALAQPCESYPSMFKRDTIFDRYPFLLPNLICAVILACGVAIGILFLEETHEKKKYNRDVGLEAGKWILSKFRRAEIDVLDNMKAADANVDESRSLLEDEQPPGYRTTDGSPRQPSSRALSPVPTEDSCSMRFGKDLKKRQRRGVQKAFNKQVILNIVGYGILA